MSRANFFPGNIARNDSNISELCHDAMQRAARVGASRDSFITSVPIPKFAQACGSLGCELRNQRGTSKLMILVPLLNLKFFIELAGSLERTSNSQH